MHVATIARLSSHVHLHHHARVLLSKARRLIISTHVVHGWDQVHLARVACSSPVVYRRPRHACVKRSTQLLGPRAITIGRGQDAIPWWLHIMPVAVIYSSWHGSDRRRRCRLVYRGLQIKRLAHTHILRIAHLLAGKSRSCCTISRRILSLLSAI